MANEISVSVSLRAQKGNSAPFRSWGPVLDDWTGSGGFNPGSVDIGTTEEVISFGDVTPGWVVLRNLDPTNYVTYGPTSGGVMVPLGRLNPGKPALLFLAAGVTLRMQANTAACRVQIEAIDS